MDVRIQAIHFLKAGMNRAVYQSVVHRLSAGTHEECLRGCPREHLRTQRAGMGNHCAQAERDPRRITLAELRMWVAELASRGLSTVTIVRKIQSVRAFFHFLVRRHGMVSNPASRLVTPRLPKVLPEYVRQPRKAYLILLARI